MRKLEAAAGTVAVGGSEGVVERGRFDLDQSPAPGVYRDRIVEGAVYARRIERLTTRP